MLRIEQHVLRLLECDRKSLFLGIITVDGQVVMKEADSKKCPGHKDLLKLEPGLKPRYGFSVLAARGRVTEMFRTSALNPSKEDGLLPRAVVEELKAVLPVGDDLTVYGH